ncbi:hypothetical protein KY361_03955 [Candidatus Woesearchaeota archaeon]|nr:hypothetical protein [Candidatus Woesearchaeota archaeon]
MKFKGLILAVAYLILLSTFVSAENFTVRGVYAIIGSNEDLLADGEEIFVRPGTTLQIKGVFENKFSTESKVDADIDMEGIIEDIDGGSNIQKSGSLDLDPESVDSIILTFQIPHTTTGNDYKLDIEIDAQDDNDNKYNYDYDYPIEIIKPEHEVMIDNIELGSDVIECEPNIDISFDILNTGDRKEDDVKYIIENAALGIYLKRTGLILDEGKTTSIAKKVVVDESAPAGDYTIDISAYCDDDRTSVRRSAAIKKEACSAAAQTNTQTQQDTQSSTQQTDSTTAVNNQPADSPPADTPSSEQGTGTQQRVVILPDIEQPKKTSPLPVILLISTAIIVMAITAYFVINTKK